MSERVDQLFFLEILVQTVQIDKMCLDNSIDVYLDMSFGELPHLLFHPEGFQPGDDGYVSREIFPFNCGKTCIFLMAPQNLVHIIEEYPIGIGMMKIINEEPVIIANSEIRLSQEILEMVQGTTNVNSPIPMSKYMESNFQLLDPNEDDVGEIQAFVRLTCLGLSVLTQIKMSQDDKFQFEKEPKFVDASCKGCETGRPGNEMADEMNETCDSEISENSEDLKSPAPQTISSIDTTASQYKRNEKAQEDAETMKILANCTKSENIKRKKKRGGNYGAGNMNRPYPEDHVICHREDRMIPARQGWAWKTALPPGLKKIARIWVPGYITPEVIGKIDEARAKRGLLPQGEQRHGLVKEKKKKGAFLHVHKGYGSYTVMLKPGVGSKPIKLDVARTGCGDNESELEFDFDVPAAEGPILVHRQTQYHEHDCPAAPATVPNAPATVKKNDTGKKRGK